MILPRAGFHQQLNFLGNLVQKNSNSGIRAILLKIYFFLVLFIKGCDWAHIFLNNYLQCRIMLYKVRKTGQNSSLLVL